MPDAPLTSLARSPRCLSALVALLLAAVLLLTAATPVAGGAPTFALDDGVVTVTTDRYEAVFEAGCLSALTNRLTGEVYATRSAALANRLPYMAHGLGVDAGDANDRCVARLWSQFHTWQGGYGEVDRKPVEKLGGVCFLHHPTAESTVRMKRTGKRSARVTWAGLRSFGPDGTTDYPDETFTLELSVAAAGGTLEISAIAQSPRPGGVHLKRHRRS